MWSSVPAHNNLLVRTVASILSQPNFLVEGIFVGEEDEAVWRLAPGSEDSKQCPVMCNTELIAVTLKKSLCRASVQEISSLYHQGFHLRIFRCSRLAFGRSCRSSVLRLRLTSPARIRRSISANRFWVPVAALLKQVN